MTDLASCRQPRTEGFATQPELFPAGLSEGFVLQDTRWSLKPQLMLRRLALKATAGVFLGRPSFLLPSRVGRSEEVAKALYRRPWGVPFDAWVSVFGRDAMDWDRAELALGRPASVGRTVKQPAPLPAPVRADEQPPWALGPAVSGATPGGGGGRLGATVPAAAAADAREAAYRACAAEARALSPTDSPQTGCTDGWEGTPSAWRRLVPTGCILLGFLHAVRTSAARCGRARARRRRVLGRGWAV